MKKYLFSLFILLLGGYSAFAQLITFDDQGHVNNGSYGNPYTISNGGETFVFTISGGGPTANIYRTIDNQGCANTGISHLYAGNTSATTWTIETQSGNEINLGTVRFDNLFNCLAFSYLLTIQGFKNGGLMGSQALTVAGPNTTWNSSAVFDDVDRIVITATDIVQLGIDNINWTPATPPCTNPTITSLTGPAAVCFGNSATLNITGSLNGATQWSVYTGSCGGTLIGTTSSSTFVTPAISSNTTFFVRGTGGCVVPGACTSVTVNVSNVSVNALSQTNVSCNGGANGAAAVSAPTGGVAPYTFNWTPGNPTGDGTASVMGLTAGTWTCTVTDAIGCTGTRNFTITQPSAITLNALSQTNVSCNGGSNGAAAVAAPTGGVGSFTFNWTPGNPTGDGTASVTGLTAGTWTCTVTDANSCTASRNFTITQPPVLSVTAASQTNVACNGGATGAASVNTPTGGAGGYTFNWTPGNPTGDGTASVTGLTAGTWTCTVTDANSCTASQNFTITQPPALSVTAASQTNVACNGGATGAASVNTPTGGAGGYTFNWTPGNPTGDGTASVTGLTAGTWTCTVTDANGCTAAQNFTVTQPTAITLNALSQTNVSCNGGSNGTAAVAAPTGGVGSFTFNWTPGNPTGDGTASVTGLTAGTWTCTVTDANSCTASRNFTITQPPVLSVTAASQTNVACNGGPTGAASVNTPTGGAGGYTFNWTPGNPTGDGTASVTGLTAGTWTCTVTDANSCTASQNFTITQPPVLSVTAASQTNVTCNGGATGAASVNTPTGGAGGYTFNWTPGNPTGDGTASVTGLTAGTWTCTVTDANSCTTTQNFVITQPSSAVSATLSVISNYNGQSISCNGASDGSILVTGSGGTVPYTFLWSNGATTAANVNLAAGTYSCTVTDVNGCPATQSITLTQPTLASVSTVVNNNVTCNGFSDGSATATGVGGTGPYYYLWSNSSSSTTAIITNEIAGTYSVTATDVNGCTAVGSATITQPAVLTVTAASQTNASCGFANGAASVNTPTGGTAPYTFDWSPGNPPGDGTASISGLPAGTWTCGVTDANGCTASQVFTITSSGTPDNASFSYSASSFCVNATDPTPTVTGLPGGTFSSTAGLSLNAATGAIDVSASTPGVYTVTYLTNGPCPNSSTASITINALDNASFNYSNAAYCGNGVDPTPTITGLAGGTFSSAPAGLSLNAATGVIDLSASANGTYTITYTTNGVCVNTSSAIVTVNAPSTGLDVQIACDSFTWIDGITYYVSNNTATFTLMNAAGCDSVVTLDLTINYSSTGVDVQTACGSYTWIDGITYNASNNTAQFIVPNALGCDSLITLDLTILTEVFANVSDVGCDSYTWAQNGMTYTSSGVYNDTLFGGSVNGCDSIIVLNLTINSSSSSVDVVDACDSYTWLNGVTYTTSNNSATMTYTNAAGCDSIVTLNLTMNYSTSSTEEVFTCDPSYTWAVNGSTYTASGMYSTVLTSSTGCDSTVVLDLTVGGGIDVTVTQAGAQLIASQFIAEYQWVDCATNELIEGATGQTYSPGVAGSFAVIITDNNCTDTSDCINFIPVGLDELTSESIMIYPNPSSGDAINFVYEGMINTVEVVDVLGRSVIPASKLQNNKLDVSELSYGKYIVRISTESDVIIKEIIIAR